MGFHVLTHVVAFLCQCITGKANTNVFDTFRNQFCTRWHVFVFAVPLPVPPFSLNLPRFSLRVQS